MEFCAREMRGTGESGEKGGFFEKNGKCLPEVQEKRPQNGFKTGKIGLLLCILHKKQKKKRKKFYVRWEGKIFANLLRNGKKCGKMYESDMR